MSSGEGVAIVFTSDSSQIDYPYLDTQSSGVTYLIEKRRGQNVYAHVHLLG